ncbi:MAG TPA: hypothetical protein VIO62_14285 [Candidatus Dormibacteraeota bacterium]|jgi:hypothetical protein
MATDIIRIVPIHPGLAAAAPTTPPNLTYRGGPLLTAVQVFTVFWGSAWQGAQAQLAQQLNGFFGYVLTSPLQDQMTEYNTAGSTIGHGALAGTRTIIAKSPARSITDARIQSAIQAWIKAGTVPQPTLQTLYFVYLPPGVTVSMGRQKSCSAFCGYHESIGGKIFYAVMPFPGCSGCAGGLAPLDALTSTSSHELYEAVTDPIPGQGWYDDANGEIGDICAWQTKKLDPWTVQLEWSNRAGRCL